MIDVAAYSVFVCVLFPVQGGMWTYLPVLEKTYTPIHDMLPHRS